MDLQPNRGSCRATVHGQRMPTAKRKAAEAPAQPCARETKERRKQRAPPVTTFERDEHCGPVPNAAWQKDAESRKAKGRVEVFNATRPGGLDGWTMDEGQYEVLKQHILGMLRGTGAEGVRLQAVVDAANAQLAAHPLFPKGRLTNYVRYTKVDLEARCIIERIPRSAPQRICLWRE